MTLHPGVPQGVARRTLDEIKTLPTPVLPDRIRAGERLQTETAALALRNRRFGATRGRCRPIQQLPGRRAAVPGVVSLEPRHPSAATAPRTGRRRCRDHPRARARNVQHHGDVLVVPRGNPPEQHLQHRGEQVQHRCHPHDAVVGFLRQTWSKTSPMPVLHGGILSRRSSAPRGPIGLVEQEVTQLVAPRPFLASSPWPASSAASFHVCRSTHYAPP